MFREQGRSLVGEGNGWEKSVDDDDDECWLNDLTGKKTYDEPRSSRGGDSSR